MSPLLRTAAGTLQDMMPLVLLALSVVPVEVIVEDRVSVIEQNHFYSDDGKHVFDQQIFWDWNGTRYQVVAWRMLKSPDQLPQRDRRGGWYVLWKDDKDNEPLRHIRAESIRETWTQYDPELAEREVLPQERRRGLTKVTLRRKAA